LSIVQERRRERGEGKVGRSHDKHLTNTEETLIPIKKHLFKSKTKQKLNKNIGMTNMYILNNNKTNKKE